MTLITYHTSTLILQAERLFSTTELGGILKSALHALGETGCDAATVTFTGVTVSGDSLEAALAEPSWCCRWAARGFPTRRCRPALQVSSTTCARLCP